MTTFQTILNYFAQKQASKHIKRYVVGARLIFGKSITIPVLNIPISAMAPAGNRLRVFNSFSELNSGFNANGSVDFINTKEFSELTGVILEPSTIRALMEYTGNPYEYIQRNLFNASVIHQGKRKYFRYQPNQMLLVVNYSEKFETYQKMKDAAEYEEVCREFVELAQRNARAIATIGKSFARLSAADQTRFRKIILDHNNTIDDFKRKLIPGFYLNSAPVALQNVPGIGFVVAPVVWIVGLVVAGLTVVTVAYLQKRAEVQKQKNLLEAQYNAVLQLKEAQEDLNAGRINQGQYNDRKEIITKNRDDASENLDKLTEADAKEQASGGFMGKIQNVLIAGAIVLVAKEVFKSS